ncbi:16530_t:CDS:10 [Funneliformis caledonium]|uniref:16530_t:CDS:1 n=1 Tax=Funneliformis caledonium TaxID=1117310 RepID=A0A9N9BDP8_9GLOM|nr:16530_t:CDS:10 [Funneliformis caledonium]
MHLLPECLNAVKYPAFWESTSEPSLKKFLDFRLSAGNLEDMKTEYNRYKKELNEISKFYTEVSEFGQKVQKWKTAFKAMGTTACLLVKYTPRTTLRPLVQLSTSTTLQPVALGSKRSSIIKRFWEFQNERQNIVARNNLQEEQARMKIQELQTNQHITVATVATEQIQKYATSTTTSIAKRFLDNSNERTSKRNRTHKDSNNDDDNEDNPFWVPGEKSSISQDQLSSDDNPFLISGSNDEFEIVTELGNLDEVQNEESGVKTLSPSSRNYNEDTIFLTPNKRQMNDGRIVQYLNVMRQLLKHDRVVVQKPSVWTESLNIYIDNKLRNNFKSEIMQKIDGDENNTFRLYCEKILMDFYNMVDIFPNLSRKIGERKYIVQNISSLFKFYEVTFGNMCFDWIESHSPASKLTKTPTNSGIVKVDVRGVRLFDDKEIFHVEVSGPPSPPSHDHAVNDTKKSLHTDILNLIAILLDHLRIPVENATEIKVFSLQVIDGTFLTSELYSTLLPFSLDAISKYKGILYLMAIFHEEIMKQISIMKNLDLIVDNNGRNIVRDVLKIPKALKDLLLYEK